MAVLEEIVRNLLVIVIMASFFELLVPDGNIKPFVRFAIGLFILITILHPALALLNDNISYKLDLWDYQPVNLNQDDILANGRKVNQQISENSNAVVKEKLEGQISAMIMLVPGVEDVKINADIGEDGSVKKLTMKVTPNAETTAASYENNKAFSGSNDTISRQEQQLIRSKITAMINNLYGLENADIDIQFKEG